MASNVRPRPAWYAGTPGRAGDWITVLHPPYTAWHLGYVLVGAGLATHVDATTLAGTLLAFGLAVGVGAHAFDELRGRPLGTAIPSRALVGTGAVALAAAAAIGMVGIHRIGWGLLPFIVVGVALVIAYNLELGPFHGDAVFAIGWGAFPVLTAYFAQTGTCHSGSRESGEPRGTKRDCERCTCGLPSQTTAACT